MEHVRGGATDNDRPASTPPATPPASALSSSPNALGADAALTRPRRRGAALTPGRFCVFRASRAAGLRHHEDDAGQRRRQSSVESSDRGGVVMKAEPSSRRHKREP
ncbi:unnamed protein product [Lampetra planeri]